MKTLVVGAGALGGVTAARLRGAGLPVWVATRDAASAARLRVAGIQVTGVGGAVSADATGVAAVDAYTRRDGFELIVLATKAVDAIDVAPRLADLLDDDGTLLPIQNGGVAQLLADRIGSRVLGGLSNLGATMTAPGRYEQRNDGHLLIGELAGGESRRAEQVRAWLGRGPAVRTTPNYGGAVWSKLLLNCSVTTIGAVAGRTMREYLRLPAGRELFDRTYRESLAVALASGARPERMMVDPVPPDATGTAYAAWLAAVLAGYGDLKPSMLQDFEHGRITEIDFINGYVADLGQRHGVPTPVNAAIVAVVHAITAGDARPGPTSVEQSLRAASR